MNEVRPRVKELKDEAEEESLARQRRTKVADGMEPADWQNQNQPGQFIQIETKVAGTTARRRKFSTNMDRHLDKYLNSPYRDMVTEFKLLKANEQQRPPWDERQKKRHFECLEWLTVLINQYNRIGVSPAQHEAGENFSEDYHKAVVSLGAKGIDLVNAGGGGGKGYWEFPADAHEAVDRAFQALSRGAGKLSTFVVQRACGHDETLSHIEAKMGWRKGTALVMLREGLNALIEHYAALKRRKAG